VLQGGCTPESDKARQNTLLRRAALIQRLMVWMKHSSSAHFQAATAARTLQTIRRSASLLRRLPLPDAIRRSCSWSGMVRTDAINPITRNNQYARLHGCWISIEWGIAGAKYRQSWLDEALVM